MKKFLIASALFLFVLLSGLYLALNSPYLIDKLARKYAPQYHFDYRKISGNPLAGVTLDALTYKGKLLARKIRLRINPYTLLQGRITVSRLQLEGVDVDVLEPMLKDFIAPTLHEPTQETESDTGIPFAFRLENIRLTLLPFQRYGVKVSREELSIDSIDYDTDRFNVGLLHQKAATSLGYIDLLGTYHRRIMQVKTLTVSRLDLQGVEALIRHLDNDATASIPQKSAEENATASVKDSSVENLFLPREIKAEKFRLSLRPYTLPEGIHLERTRVEGEGLDVDLDHRRINGGELRLSLRSDLARARLALRANPGRLVLEKGAIDRLDLEKILAGVTKAEENNTSTAPDKNASSASMPFLPDQLEVKALQIAVKPGTLEGIKYRQAHAAIENLQLDLKRKAIRKGRVGLSLATGLFDGDLKAEIDSRRIRLQALNLKAIDVEGIQSWLKSHRKIAGNEAGNHKKTESSPKGIKIPYLPPKLEADRLFLSARPFKLGTFEVNRSEILGDSLHVDLDKARVRRGTLELKTDANWLRATLRGTVQDNRLILDENGSSRLEAKAALFRFLKLPLRAEAFSPLILTGEADEKGADLRVRFHARKILAENNGSFNVDISRSLTRFKADFGEGNYTVLEEMNASLPQTALHLSAVVQSGKEGALHYTGRVQSDGIRTGNEKLDKMLGRPRIDFRGDLRALSATLQAGPFLGRFESTDFKTGRLSLRTSRALQPARYIKLPAKLQGTRVNLSAEMPVDFSKPLPLESNLTLSSNVATLKGTLRYDSRLHAKFLGTFPKNSLLKSWLPKLKLSALEPLKISIDETEKSWRMALANRVIKGNLDYMKKRKELKGTLGIAGSRLDITGEPQERIEATLHTASVRKMMLDISRIYPFPDPKLDGDLTLKMMLEKLTQATVELRSKKFIPDSSARIKAPINNIELLVSGDLKKRSLTLKKYHLETAGLTLYATKPGHLMMQKGTIRLQEFWINDSLKITGQYDPEKKAGNFVAKAARFKLKHKYVNLESSVDIKGKILADKIEAQGKIVLLGGTVNYNLEAKHYATDEDIVILQHLKKNQGSFFRKNVQLTLYIQSEKPLVFHQKNVKVELRPQMSLIKSFDGDLQMLGSIALAKEGYYIFQGKKFVLSPSSINFIGNPTRPLLDINLVYRRYGRTIYISVSGSATEPSLQFSSSPFMTRDQILSFILFDTVDSGNNAGNMLSIVGGGIAKSILGNIGLKVDTLIVTSNGFEVGKKITDKITLLYDQREGEPKVIVRIQHSAHTETDISIGSESQSADIIYRKEF